MTIPWLANCPHCEDGWCLACVKELGEDNARLRALTAAREGAVTYQWPAFRLVYRPDTGQAITYYEGDPCWSGCEPVLDDTFHAKILGITPGEHRLAHELAHHLVGWAMGNALGSPVIWLDAHRQPQRQPHAEREEWYTSALVYQALGWMTSDQARESNYAGACVAMGQMGWDIEQMSRTLAWLCRAPKRLGPGSLISMGER